MDSRRKSIFQYAMLALASVILYLPVMNHASQSRFDFGSHIGRALRMPDALDHVSAVLFHAVFLSIHRLLGLPHQPAALIAILLVMIPVPLIAFALLRRSVSPVVPDGALAAFALGLVFMSPITVWNKQIHAWLFESNCVSQSNHDNCTPICASGFYFRISYLSESSHTAA